MLHIKQSLTEIKESAYEQNTPPTATRWEEHSEAECSRSETRLKNRHWHSQADQEFSMHAEK